MGLKMWWKDRKYWQKGGIIGIIVGFVLSLIVLIIGLICVATQNKICDDSLFLRILGIPAGLLFVIINFGFSFEVEPSLLFISFAIPFYILIGVFIGYLISLIIKYTPLIRKNLLNFIKKQRTFIGFLKYTLITIIILYALFVFSLQIANYIFAYTKVPTLAKEDIPLIDYCERDSDCMITSGGGCGCGGGGSVTAVNKYNYKAPNSTIECFAVMSNDWSCFAKIRCIKNQCVLMGRFKVE